MHPLATIYDIAKKTGFSSATVSKVLNNISGVKKKTQETVLQAAKEMGYTINANARALITKKSWLIGVLFSEDIGTGIAHPHYSGILQSFQKYVNSKGYDIIFVNQWLGNKKVSFLEHCLYRSVDGVLIASVKNFTHEVQSVVDSSLKCISVEMPYPERYSVLSDNYLGSMQALEYLYILGHRKIAHIAGPLFSTAGWERYSAYKDFLQSKGLEYNPLYMIEASAYSPDEGKKAIHQLINNCWNDMPTAIFAAYDLYAMPAVNILQERGFRVPADISMIGFDNLEVSESASPGLTTINQDRAEIGRKAAELLVDLIENGASEEPLDVRIPTTLVMRGTCARVEV
jgi:DNA-binding LacI/PurR family transcriptional regulator